MNRDRTSPRAEAGFCLLLGLLGIALLQAPLPTGEAVRTNYYPLIWWSFILALEGFNSLRGRGLFLHRTAAQTLQIAFLGTLFWYVFEVFNLYLGNWYYVGVPRDPVVGFLTASVAFATVLPGLWLVKQTLAPLMPGRLDRGTPRTIPGWVQVILLAVGGMGVLGPLLFPDQTFPLVWVGLLFLLDWVSYRADWNSYLADWETGRYRSTVAWLTAGLLCGVLWEYWNSLAGAGWIYTVPYMGEWRIFEMPVLGYLGFPPFALMIRRMYTVSRELMNRLSVGGRLIVYGSGILLMLLSFAGMHSYTIVSHPVDPERFTGWTAAEQRRLNTHPDRDLRTRKRHAEPDSTVRKKLDLLTYAHMGVRTANCLWESGVRSVDELLATNTNELAATLRDCRRGPYRFWYRRVIDWKQRAPEPHS